LALGVSPAEVPIGIFGISPAVAGSVAGIAVAWIFLLRMRIEEMVARPAPARQASEGFETEDILYLLRWLHCATSFRAF